MRCKTKHLARACKTQLDNTKECHRRRYLFHRKPRPKGCYNHKPISVLKLQYCELK